MGGDDFGIIANIAIYENGTFTQTLYMYGVGAATNPVFTDLSQFGNSITKIRIYNITDTWGLGFEDVKFTPTGTVDSLILEQIDSPLDANPNSGGGLSVSDNRRIFPDKVTPSDALNRRRVRVRATTSLGANKTVYFKAFDVDDPSSDATPVDANGSAGNDNRGVPANSFGGLSATSAQTDSNGVATVEFMTTMQPGDNFRIAASADQTYLNGLFSTGISVKDSTGAFLPTQKAKATPMLTVWT